MPSYYGTPSICKQRWIICGNSHKKIREEDEKRLSPLLHGHVNVLGHYSFTLAKQIMMGQLRPLNQYSENIIILP